MRPQHLIDFHVHCFPDHVAEKAMAGLKETYRIEPHADGTRAGLLAYMERAGVDISVILPVATRPGQVKSINDWAAGAQSERIVAFGALHPDFAEPAAEVERICALGMKGIKLQPQWQEFYPDEARAEGILRAAEGRLIVSFHAGNEIVPVENVRSTPGRLAKVKEKFPRLRMVAAHFGGYLMWKEVEAKLLGREGVYLDTSYCPPRDLPDERMLALIRGHGVSRILFASDFPFGEPLGDLARLMKLGLTQEELEDICWRNAARLLGVEV